MPIFAHDAQLKQAHQLGFLKNEIHPEFLNILSKGEAEQKH